MKKLFYVLVALTLVTSCKKDSTVESKLVVSTETLVFNEVETKYLYISTKPKSETEFQVIEYPNWVAVSPLSGFIAKNIEQITVQPTYSTSKPAIYEGSLVIMSSCGNDTVKLKGFVGEHFLYNIPDSVNFSIFSGSKNLVIKNSGNIKINFSANTSNNLISLSSSTGEIAAGEEAVIVVTADRSSMETEVYNCKINLTLNEINETVDVKIENYKENKIFFPSDVMDAEYSKTRDIIVYIATYPSSINIYNTSSNTVESIPLTYVPTCVSLSSDGTTAAVGHDGHVSYVDLVNKTVIRTFSVSCNASDVVLGNNKWAYLFPNGYSWTEIRCVNLNLTTDNEVLNSGYSINGCTKARLHPSGKFIYGADNNVTPSDIEKYDIQSGKAALLYDSPYHGNYPMNGDLWLSEDGVRIFTKGKTVLKTSEVQSQDMLYNGTITLEGTYEKIMWLDHSTAKSNLYIISSTNDYSETKNKPYIYVYNATNLLYKSKIELEKYVVMGTNENGATYNAIPYFVFSNKTGDCIYALTKADGSGLVNEWAVEKISIP